MLVFTKVKRIKWIISKIWILYAAHNNTKYYLIASYFLESQQIAEPVENTTKLDEVF